jgi:hypothetical protein
MKHTKELNTARKLARKNAKDLDTLLINKGNQIMAKTKIVKKEAKNRQSSKGNIMQKIAESNKDRSIDKVEPIQVEEKYTPTYYTNRFNGKLYTAGLSVWNNPNYPEVELTPVPPAIGNKVWIKTKGSSNFYLSDQFGNKI